MKLTNKRLKRLIKEALVKKRGKKRLIKEAKLSRQQHKVRRHINKLKKANKIDKDTWTKARRAVYKDPQGQAALTFLSNYSKEQQKAKAPEVQQKTPQAKAATPTQQTANTAVSSAMAAAKDAIKPQAKQQIQPDDSDKLSPADYELMKKGGQAGKIEKAKQLANQDLNKGQQAATPKVGQVDPAAAAKQKKREDAMVAASGKTQPQQQQQQKKYDFSSYDNVPADKKKKAIAVLSKKNDPRAKALVQYLQKSLGSTQTINKPGVKSTVQTQTTTDAKGGTTQTTTTDAKLDHSADDTGIRARMATAALQNARKKYDPKKNEFQRQKISNARQDGAMLYDTLVAAGWNPKTGYNGISKLKNGKYHQQRWKKLIGN